MTQSLTIAITALALAFLTASCSPGSAKATSWQLKCKMEDGSKADPIRIRITEENRIFIASTGDFVEYRVVEALPNIPHFQTDGPLDGSGPFTYEIQRNSSLWSLVLGEWLAFRDLTRDGMSRLAAAADRAERRALSTAVYSCKED